jgi:hypothetical protein
MLQHTWELGSLDHAQKGNSSRHRIKSSRWSSEGSHPFQEEKGIKTEHRLFRWIPIRVDKRPTFCYTRLSNPQEDLSKHEGYLTKTLDLYPGSRRGFDWLRRKLDLWASRKNEARGRKNWGKRGAVRRYRKPEKIPRKQNSRRKSHLATQ